jgi:hypothetical protein
MAFPATLVLNYRADATANNVNGGGFDPAVAVPGTDYSNLATAQYAYTAANASSNDITVGASPYTTITSVKRPFVAADVGNVLHFSAGTNLVADTADNRWPTIISIAGGVATLSHAIATGAMTNGAGYLGGALSLPVSAFWELLVPGMVVQLRTGTLTPAAINVTTAAGTELLPITVKGLTLAGAVPVGDDRPLIDATTVGFMLTTQSWRVSDIRVTHATTGTTTTVKLGGHYSLVERVKVTNTYSGANATYGINGLGDDNVFVDCEFANASSNATSCAFAPGNTQKLIRCWLRDSVLGANIGAARIYLVACEIEDCTTGLRFASAAVPMGGSIERCLFISKTLSGTTAILDATSSAGSLSHLLLRENIIQGWATGVSRRQASPGNSLFERNVMFGNTANYANVAAAEYSKDFCVENGNAVDPQFVDATNHNYTPRGLPRSMTSVPSGLGCNSYQVPGPFQPNTRKGWGSPA